MAQQSGIFSSRLDVGRWIRVGEELGQIYDSFSGGVRARVGREHTGLDARDDGVQGIGDGLARCRLALGR